MDAGTKGGEQGFLSGELSQGLVLKAETGVQHAQVEHFSQDKRTLRMASLWALVALVGLLAGQAVMAAEYYDKNYRNENPFYRYSGPDSYQYEDGNKWRVGRSTFFNEFHR